MTDLFQIPTGPQPLPLGTRVRCAGRPWWGEGVVEHDERGRFLLRFAGGLTWTYTADGWRELRGETVREEEE